MKESLAGFFTLRWLKTWFQSTMKEILTGFPTLRLLKTKLQSTMKEDRLTGLVLMAIKISRFYLDKVASFWQFN